MAIQGTVRLLYLLRNFSQAAIQTLEKLLARVETVLEVGLDDPIDGGRYEQRGALSRVNFQGLLLARRRLQRPQRKGLWAADQLVHV